MAVTARSLERYYLLVAGVLLVGLGVTTWSLVLLPEHTKEVARGELERTGRELRGRLQGEFDHIARDLRTEAAYVALHDSMARPELLERWQALMAAEPAVLGVHLANERGAELALLRTTEGLRVRRQLEGTGHGFPVSWLIGADGQGAPSRIDNALYDPRMEEWFSRALAERQAVPVWSSADADTTGARLVVSQLIRAVRAGRPFRVAVVEVDARTMVNGVRSPSTDRSFQALVLGPDGRPILELPPDSTVLGIACRRGLAQWRERMDRRTVAVADGPDGHLLQLLPFTLNGITLHVGAIADLGQVGDGVDGRPWLLWSAFTALVLLLILLVMLFTFSRRDRRRLRVQAKRSRTQERKLAKVIGERNVLDREVHHRVKNNLQVVSSLLNMQAQRLADGPARDEFMRGKQRIEVLALVHNKLYALPDLRAIPLDRYFQELAAQMTAMNRPHSSQVSCDVETNGIRCNPDQAIDLGIILCELLNNCHMHAFPLVTGGHIDVLLEALADGTHRLRVHDNGRGMKPGARTGAHLGLDVVEALAEKLDGTFRITGSNGTTAEVVFKLGPLPEE